ncbi:GNAT family N-acetyltransferase [Billgrantia pellis]|uniref:GNAT family N-acetyltransferase n=2 Tax=Billgrantia pellis TaxID=2606936 RepID=A0A7V7KHV4_9GAMM|nr:GNAT family N-acetyltransferase [Halomonas pellis]
MKRFIKQARALVAGLHVIRHSLILAHHLARREPVQAGAVVYRGLQKHEYDQAMAFYTALHDGRRLAWPQRFLYRLAGDKLVLVAVIEESGATQIIGIDMFYVNARDRAEHTVHEGYIGVRRDMTGKGVATELRKVAIEHFARHGLKGVSSRISADNAPSLVSAKKLGFVPVDRYHDAAMRAERLYLIRWFQEGR